MNVAFVTYHDFTSQSAIHVFHLASALAAIGDDCTVCVPDGASSVDVIGTPTFRVAEFADLRSRPLQFSDGRGPDVVHAWTPRERVRQMVERIVAPAQCPYVVHLEDNEERIVEYHLGIPWSTLARWDAGELDRRIGDGMSHPHRYRAFLEHAGGVSVIVDRLLEFVPSGVPARVVWPAFDPSFLDLAPGDPALREQLGIAPEDFVVVYPGNVHASNRDEVASLYLAVGLVNRHGIPLKLVRLGLDCEPLLGSEREELRPHVIELGYRPNREMARYVALADVLVQPGCANRFNDFRLPAKLPEFLATGRPVIVPDTNIGHALTDEVNCLLLRSGTAFELADKLERLLREPDLRARLGRDAREFAMERLRWSDAAVLLRALYADAQRRWRDTRRGAGGRVLTASPMNGTGGSAVVLDDAALATLPERYGRYSVSDVGYGTVRDFSDSLDHLGGLATSNADMKDIQRPWALKAILGHVPRGARLVEIGGGEPLVADVLARLGYEVFVVDPYDGSGGGVAEYSAVVKRYPRVRIIRGRFTENLLALAPRSVDCVYSISVLEHLSEAELADAFAGIRRVLTRGGWSIHAVDHVHKGNGQEFHLARQRAIAAELGIAEERFEHALGRMEDDVDTYFLSAEAHNRWRGRQTYDSFPMRRCVSINFCVSPASGTPTGANGADTTR